MRIPSGDLAPMRRHRRGRSAYGRRHNPVPAVLAVVLLLAVAGGAYALRRDDAQIGRLAQAARCPTASPAAPASPAAARAVRRVALPAPRQVRLRLLNGTGRDGLARSVGNELARRGFGVAAMGNAPRLAGASSITFGPGARPAATLLAAHVLGARIVPVPAAAAGAVDVTLGTSFVRLRTPAEVSSFVRRSDAAVPVVRPKQSPACR